MFLTYRIYARGVVKSTCSKKQHYNAFPTSTNDASEHILVGSSLLLLEATPQLRDAASHRSQRLERSSKASIFEAKTHEPRMAGASHAGIVRRCRRKRLLRNNDGCWGVKEHLKHLISAQLSKAVMCARQVALELIFQNLKAENDVSQMPTTGLAKPANTVSDGT